jgi:hypothetical protein
MVVLLTTASLEGQHLAKSFFNTGLLGAAGSSGPVDEEFNRVSFLSHFEGSNNGVNNAFDDGSTSNHTITAAGNVTQGSFNPYRTNWGVDFPDSDNNWVTVSSHADLAIGANDDYTFEYFIFFRNKAVDQVVLDGRYANNYANGTVPILSIRGLVDYQGNAYDPVTAGAVNYSCDSSSGGLATLTSNDLMVFGAWNHVAAVRSSGTVNLYLNGIRQTANYTNNTTVATQSPWKLGDLHHPTAVPTLQFKNILSNFRYVKGTAVYSGSSFTVPTSPLTAITNTKLLVFQSDTIVDNSATGHTLTVNGSPAVTTFGPSLTSAVYDPAVNGASAYMDGTGDSLSAASSADFALGTGDFTVEFWVYQKEVKNYTIYFDYRASNGYNAVYLYQGSNGVLDLYIGSNSHTFTPPSLLNRWAHIAIARSSGTTKTFVDGVQYLSFSDSTDYIQGSTFYVGRFWDGDTHNFNGYMSDFRFVKGTAVYTSAFTPPTAPLTAITNTKLLLNMANGQAIDSAAQNNLTLVGNAKTSTAQYKFGTASMLFDGTGDYVTLPSHSFKPFNTGDFTIECFARFDAIDGKGLFQLGASYLPSAITGPAVFASVDTNNPWRIYYGTSHADASVSPSANTWYHVAYVRSSGVTKLYVDGTSVISQNDTTNYTNTFFVIGGGYSSSFLMDGYIDDFRISHMARYTSNFTAPTAAFADKGQ